VWTLTRQCCGVGAGPSTGLGIWNSPLPVCPSGAGVLPPVWSGFSSGALGDPNAWQKPSFLRCPKSARVASGLLERNWICLAAVCVKQAHLTQPWLAGNQGN
jgi:hypothetical protein